MAKRRSKRRVRSMQPAQLDLAFTIPAGGGTGVDSRSYVDTARELSKVNRRGYSQARMYAYQGLTFVWRSVPVVAPAVPIATLELSVRTAGNTWIVQNSHVKGEALWHQMQDLVLDDNPSIAGKWHDFKVRLSTQQLAARQLNVKDGAGVDYKIGEWVISKYVMPQHEVSLLDGKPIAAEEFTACLIGPDSASIRSLTEAYEQSRATVQSPMPNVPAGMSTSFFNLLTDSGSQEPELSLVIEGENDEPPYDLDEYPGGATNANVPCTVGYAAISAAEVDGRIGGFIAPCGLLEIEIKGFGADGTPIPTAEMPAIDILLHCAPGMYKGTASVPMGQ